MDAIVEENTVWKWQKRLQNTLIRCQSVLLSVNEMKFLMYLEQVNNIQYVISVFRIS